MPFAFSHQVNAAFDEPAINVNSNQVPLQDFADWPAGQTLRADVSDACASRNAGETRVREERDFFAVGNVLQRTGDLVGFLHAGAHWADAGQDKHVTGFYEAMLDRRDRILL